MDARILELCRQWQQSSLWDVAKELARVLMTEETNEAAAMKYAHTLKELHGQLVTLQELVRRERPDCLHLIPPVDFLREYSTLDVPGRIRDMMQLEGVALSEQGEQPRDATLVTAKQLGDHAGCGDKKVRVALLAKRCNPDVEASGRNGGHKWRYSKAVAALKTIESGILKGMEWPESAAQLKPRKDSSKIPAKTLKR